MERVSSTCSSLPVAGGVARSRRGMRDRTAGVPAMVDRRRSAVVIASRRGNMAMSREAVRGAS